MPERRTVGPGDVLVDRYELADLQSERLGASNWRAVDRVLHRNVRVEMLASDDARAEHFIQAARDSTAVTDPRFLQVLDVLEHEHGHHVVIREWARAVPLSEVLAQSPLPNRRAATIVAEVAEAMADAHEHGIHHRRLTPHQILLKESGAVRIVGLGVATSLAPVDHTETAGDRAHFEALDVLALGKLLYSCLVSRWPGAHVDGLRAAPTEHGRLLHPRQVRAGVAREVDSVCERILEPTPRSGPRLTHAADIARALRLAGEDHIPSFDSATTSSSPDLLRLDPVIEPSGPPPGLEPPRRRPKSFDPKPPTRGEMFRAKLSESTHGDRALRALGLVGVLLILALIVAMIVASQLSPRDDVEQSRPIAPLGIDAVIDFDPDGDHTENSDLTHLAIDGRPETGWQTAVYLNNPALGGLKDGVGLIVDLGAPHEVTQIEVTLVGSPSDVAILTAPSTLDDVPRFDDLAEQNRRTVHDGKFTTTIEDSAVTRYVLVWFRSLPEIGDNRFRGEISEIVVHGR